MSADGGAHPRPRRARRLEAEVAASLATAPNGALKWFYDEEGSRLFEEITRLPEYYPTRVERALLTEAAPEIAAEIPPGASLVEFGSGASVKVRQLLDAAPQIARYVPLDISVDALQAAAAEIARDYPHLQVIRWPATSPGRAPARRGYAGPPSLFPGSTIGNFDAPDAAAFLREDPTLLGDGRSSWSAPNGQGRGHPAGATTKRRRHRRLQQNVLAG